MADQGLALLSLDGGGIRGLSSLFILQALMERVAKAKGLSAPPKPCEYFDMIGGTSTGGIIAIMLGRLQMTVKDCISAYLTISESGFIRTHSYKFSFLGRVQETFDSRALEGAIKEILRAQNMDEEAFLYDSNLSSKCKVFVCAVEFETTAPVLLRNYKGGVSNDPDRLKYTKIWQAVRATSAASGLFHPLVIQMGDTSVYRETYIDGATHCNNPIWQLWNEARNVFSKGDATFEDRIDCIISIGTGKPTVEAFGKRLKDIAKALVKITTETEETARSFYLEHEALGKDGRYCRLTVDNGLQGIGIEDSGMKDRIIAVTKNYLNQPDTDAKLRNCEASMKKREYRSYGLLGSISNDYDSKLRSLKEAATSGNFEAVRKLFKNRSLFSEDEINNAVIIAAQNEHTDFVKSLHGKYQVSITHRDSAENSVLSASVRIDNYSLVKWWFAVHEFESHPDKLIVLITDVLRKGKDEPFDLTKSMVWILRGCIKYGTDKAYNTILFNELDENVRSIHDTFVLLSLLDNSVFVDTILRHWKPEATYMQDIVRKVISFPTKLAQNALRTTLQYYRRDDVQKIVISKSGKFLSDIADCFPLIYTTIIPQGGSLPEKQSFAVFLLKLLVIIPDSIITRLIDTQWPHLDTRDDYDHGVLYALAHRPTAQALHAFSSKVPLRSDVNRADMHGWTPLHIAAKYDTDEVVWYLLLHGADYTRRHDGGHTPLEVAPKGGRVSRLLSNMVEVMNVLRHYEIIIIPELSKYEVVGGRLAKEWKPQIYVLHLLFTHRRNDFQSFSCAEVSDVITRGL